MPNFNKSSKGFKLSGNPFQKNFPGAFKQAPEMTEAEIEANIQRAEEFNQGKGATVRTISEETRNRAEELGLFDHNEGGTYSISKEKVNNLLDEYEGSAQRRYDNPGAMREIRNLAVTYGMEDPYLHTSSNPVTPKSLDESDEPVVTGAARRFDKR